MPPINVTDPGNSATGTSGATGFCIPARNSRGKDHTIGVRCWPEFSQAVNKIIAKRAFNYRTAADLYRHAIARHLEWLGEKNPTLEEWWFVKAVRAIETKAHLAELLTITEYLSREAEVLERMGEEEQARELVREVIREISGADVPDGMKRRYLKLIMKRHRHLLQGSASGKPSQFKD